MIYINLLLIFLTIIFIHELGHYTIARFFKITVTDFSIGFGKVLYQYTDRNRHGRRQLVESQKFCGRIYSERALVHIDPVIILEARTMTRGLVRGN